MPVVLTAHPDYAPPAGEPTWAAPFSRDKYIAPDDQTFGRFVAIVRNHYGDKSSPTSALLFCVWSRGRGWVVPPMTTTMGQLDAEFRSPDDGLLYVYYCAENAFGAR